MPILHLMAQEAHQAIIGVITVAALPSLLILNIVTTIATSCSLLLWFLSSTSAKLVWVRISWVVSYEWVLQESFPTDVFKWLKQVIHDRFNTSEVGLQAGKSGDGFVKLVVDDQPLVEECLAGLKGINQ